MRRLILTAALLVAALTAAVPAQGATVRVQRFTGFQDVRVGDTPFLYRLRLSYVVPASWHQRGRANGLSRTFGPVGACRFTVRVRARVVRAPIEPPADRVARLLPATGGRLLDAGTRGNGAWRVVRTTGSATVTGLLTRPAPSMKAQPDTDGRVALELRFTATPDPRRECHTGVTRTVGAQTADALATAAIGGFQL
jgi:hypothetical protein